MVFLWFVPQISGQLKRLWGWWILSPLSLHSPYKNVGKSLRFAVFLQKYRKMTDNNTYFWLFYLTNLYANLLTVYSTLNNTQVYRMIALVPNKEKENVSIVLVNCCFMGKMINSPICEKLVMIAISPKAITKMKNKATILV